MTGKLDIRFSIDKIINYVGAFIVATFIIFAQYDMPFMSIGLNMLLIYAIYQIFREGRIFLNKSFLFFLVFAMTHQVIVYFISNTFLKNINTYFFMPFAYLMIIGGSLVNKKAFIKVYSLIGIVTSLLIIYHYILITFFDMQVNAIQLFSVAKENMHFWSIGSDRPVGVFTEPQAFCSYIIPLLAYKINKKEIKFSIFISLTILLSGSSQGILVAALIWCYYYLIQEKKTILKVGFLFISILALVLIFNSSLFEMAISKIASINFFAYDIRLTKGFMIYGAMPLLDKVIGIGFGNLEAYLRSGIFDFFWMSLTRPELFAFVTTMSNVLISFGLGGLITYISIFWKNRKSKNASKIVLWVIFVVSFSQTILFNAWFVFYWMVFFIFDENQKSVRYLQFFFPRGKY